MTTHYLPKSKQSCFLLPWHAAAPKPYPTGYERVVIPRQTPNGIAADIVVVRNDNLRKQVNNTTLPRGQWIHLTPR